MKTNQAYRYEFKPNNKQRTAFLRHAGVARFTYNWGLARRVEEYKTNGKSSGFYEQSNQLTILKKTECPWMYDVSACAPLGALWNLDNAFQGFFRRCKQGKKPGFPKFKKRGVHDSFYLQDVKLFHKAIKLPRIGKVRLKETTEKLKGRILSATVSREADRWYVSLAVERERPDPEPVQGDVVGVDVGLTHFATLSDGTKVENPRFLKRSLRVLRRRSRQFSRKQKNSNNRYKARMRLARAHRRVRNQRKDFLHKLSTALAKTKLEIVLEDLSVQNMIRNHQLARSISDAGWSEFRRMLSYKCVWYGSKLTIAPKFFPSSKTCSRCGHVKAELSLSERVFRCENCGLEVDRDLNAALNLKSTASSAESNACGEDVRPNESQTCLAASLKQEANTAVSVVGTDG